MLKELLQRQLIAHEGLRLKPYRCTAGKLTIGVGRNLDDLGITRIEALALLEHDIDQVLAQCVTFLYWTALNETRQCVIADMVFNLGAARFAQFKKLQAALMRGDYQGAADEMQNSTWFKQVGARGVKLVAMMRNNNPNQRSTP